MMPTTTPTRVETGPGVPVSTIACIAMPARIADRFAVAVIERSIPAMSIVMLMPRVRRPISEIWIAMD